MLFPDIISGVYEYIPNNVSQSPSQHPPYFDTKMERNVTSFVSQSTHLECKVHNLGDKTVSLYHHTRPPEIFEYVLFAAIELICHENALALCA